MYIYWFKDLNIKDIPLVGGKTASLGEMYGKLVKKGVKIPNGFALTADAYRAFLKFNTLDKKIKACLSISRIFHNFSPNEISISAPAFFRDFTLLFLLLYNQY